MKGCPMQNLLKKINRRRIQLQETGRRSALSFIFGRTAFVLVLLLIQFVMLIGLFARWQYATYAYGGSVLLSIGMALYLINHPLNSASRQTWLILVLLVPVVGTLLYFYVELDLGHRLVRARLEQLSRDSKQYIPVPEKLMKAVQSEDPELSGLASYVLNRGGYPIYKNTHVKYFPLGEDKFKAMLDELEQAEKFIFMEYFIIEEGFMWDSVLEVLERKVQQGVEVRVMYDGTNAIFKIPYRYPEKLRAKGIQCKMFSPIRPLFSTYHNNRDHRKILVIDGHTAFTGGVNLADEYINRKAVYGHWKDTAIMLKGQAVHSFTLMFLQMWGITERAIEYDRYLNVTLPPLPTAEGYVLPYGDSPFDDERVGEAVYIDILNQAKRYVHIMTPYLIIDSEMMHALCFAAKRGVDVRLILPHIPDKKSAFALAYTHYRELLRAGVRIYEYTPGFVHAKVFVSDDLKAVVGTINLDYRSLCLHFECAALLYKTPAIAEIEQDFRSTLKNCQQVTLDSLKTEKRYRKIFGYLLKLFAPLM